MLSIFKKLVGLNAHKNKSDSQENKTSELKFLVIGSQRVGKSQLISCVMEEAVDASPPTAYGISTDPNYMIGDKKFNLNVREVGINPVLGSNISYLGIHGIIFIFSCTDSKSFETIKRYVTEARSFCGNSIPIILIANKIDCEEQSAVKLSDVSSWTQKKELSLVSTNALGAKAEVRKIFHDFAQSAIEANTSQAKEKPHGRFGL